MNKDRVRELISRDVDADEYRAIREQWKTHSIAEDNRDIPGLIATLTPDCVYEVVNTGDRWEGHEGAKRFYTELLSAFPDIHFDLQNIVIGPQGVSEEAVATATHEADWQQMKATGEKIAFKVVIFFPWDRGRRKFAGERVYVAEIP